MTPDRILDALNDLDGQLLREARAEHKTVRKRPGRRFAVLIAAVVALMAVTVTAFASEAVSGWFKQYFGQKTEENLTQGQVQYIEENEQVIAEVQEQNGWTVELRSAISDGTKAYIIIGVTAPEGISLEQTIVDGISQDWFGPGNGTMNGSDKQELVTESVKGLVLKSYGYRLEEDGDGSNNTKNLVIELNPEFDWYADPFGADVEWYIHIENIVHTYKDEEYYQELMSGKYAGQTDVMFTSEETEKLQVEEVLAEGIWDFTVVFNVDRQKMDQVELITEPVKVTAMVYRWAGEDHLTCDITQDLEPVELTSFVLTPFGASLQYVEDDTVSGILLEYQQMYGYEDRCIYAVMKDGGRIALHTDGVGTVLSAEAPIVLSEVDYILLADGTELPMPE